MNSKKMALLVLFVLLCVGLAAYAPPALASGEKDDDPYQAGTGVIQARVQRMGLGSAMKSVVLYNDAWEVIAEKATFGESVSFSRLPVGHYHLVAYVDENDLMQSQDVDVLSNQTTRVAMQLKKPTYSCSPAQPNAKSANVSCGALSGEPSMVKVRPFYESTVVYLQCGKVVEKIGPACGCRAGGWNYITSCPKGPTIYVNLPCPRGAKP